MKRAVLICSLFSSVACSAAPEDVPSDGELRTEAQAKLGQAKQELSACPTPDWELARKAPNHEWCLVDKDSHIVYYELELYVADRYRDRHRCSPDSYKLRSIDKATCLFKDSERFCLDALGLYEVPKSDINKNNCPGPLAAKFSSSWEEFVSEEQGPAFCPAGSAVDGIHCRGRFCDDVALRCGRSPHDLTGPGHWTRWFSEEGNSSQSCDSGEIMTGLQCAGDFCDSVRLYCEDTDSHLSQCSWGRWFSEETPSVEYDGQRVAVGMQCRGRFCDGKRLRTCAIGPLGSR